MSSKAAAKKQKSSKQKSSTKATATTSAANKSGSVTTTTTVTLVPAATSLAVLGAFLLLALNRIGLAAYEIRLYAIKEFGKVIHEFDPYFNYRATVYLYEHGWKAFATWFDYTVWYPLGRPVGTTIYPGMQVTAVWLKNHVLPGMSINDICCYIPAWFGVSATLAVAALTYEATRDQHGSSSNAGAGCLLQDIPLVGQLYNRLFTPTMRWIMETFVEPAAGGRSAVGFRRGSGSNSASEQQVEYWWTPAISAVAAAAIMSIVPAHLLRSIGGGYDNESIAMTAMVTTFWLWCVSLRDGLSATTTTLLGIATGCAYFYMVAAWGGYVFVLNLIGLHATFLVAAGRYSTKLHRAYTAFYLVGTALATTVPVVGWTPLKSLEQMGPLAAFLGMQLLEYCEIQKRRHSLSTKQTWLLRCKVVAASGVALAVVCFVLWNAGYFGPISSRVRGLFVKHTKTGNPLVDSVAEHQAASSQAYFQYLHDVCYLLPAGMAFVVLNHWNDASSFLLVYAAAAYFFSHKMVRLILLTAPIASAIGGVCLGRLLSWGAVSAVLVWDAAAPEENKADTAAATTKNNDSNKNGTSSSSSTNGKDSEKQKDTTTTATTPKPAFTVTSMLVRGCRLALTAYAIREGLPHAQEFYNLCHEMAQHISHPTIIQKARTNQGVEVLVDDYREAYNWLGENTPEDARVMAWWDYGYQISGISNRTTIADGNTWNHEHIALLGRILTGPEKEAHRIARHLADYVLIWAGGGGDDLAKSPHLRRIANSVYRGLCAEPTCRDFGRYQDGTPTESMKGSLLYTLHSHRMQPGVEADRNRFQEVFMSKYGKVRIYKIKGVSKESKEWVKNNRVCDAPGSWFCPGQYPPALQKIIDERRDFAQLEDFNRGSADEEYTKEYFENLNKKGGDASPPPGSEKLKLKKLSEEEIEEINEHWENDEVTTMMWELVSQQRTRELRDLFAMHPEAPHRRSEDGRGPMWWAHENGHAKIVQFLKKLGVSETLKDANGVTPLDISKV